MCSSEEISQYSDTVQKLVDKTAKDNGFDEFTIDFYPSSAKGNNFLGYIYHAKVTDIKTQDKKDELELVVKLAPKYQRDKIPVNIFYRRELYAYESILPTLIELQNRFQIPNDDKLTPVEFYSGDITDLKENIVLKDMSTLDFKMVDKFKFLDFNHVVIVLKNLAALHALSFALKEERKEKFEEFSGNIYQGVEVTETYEAYILIMIDKAISAMENFVHKEKLISYKQVAFEKFKFCAMPELAQPYTVFCHGDCWTSNLLFKYQDNNPVSLRLIDWQMIRQGSPVLDIIYLLCTSTDTKLRQKHYYEFLDIYYESLKLNLARLNCDIDVCYPETVFKQHLKSHSSYGFIMMCLISHSILSDVEDTPDFDKLLLLDTDEISRRLKVTNDYESENRYRDCIRSLVKDFIDFELL